MTTKAIETKYDGYRFRSRLEARWAVFFDALGFLWRYEIEGFNLGELGYYLPDFFIGNKGIGVAWVEIKPHLFTTDGVADGTAEVVARLQQLNHIQIESSPYDAFCSLLLAGVPGQTRSAGLLIAPAFGVPDGHDGKGHAMAHIAIAECPSCREICCLALDPQKEKHMVICTCLGSTKVFIKDRKIDLFVFSERLKAAYSSSRSARFEHGETPRVLRGRQNA